MYTATEISNWEGIANSDVIYDTPDGIIVETKPARVLHYIDKPSLPQSAYNTEHKVESEEDLDIIRFMVSESPYSTVLHFSARHLLSEIRKVRIAMVTKDWVVSESDYNIIVEMEFSELVKMREFLSG